MTFSFQIKADDISWSDAVRFKAMHDTDRMRLTVALISSMVFDDTSRTKLSGLQTASSVLSQIFNFNWSGKACSCGGFGNLLYTVQGNQKHHNLPSASISCIIVAKGAMRAAGFESLLVDVPNLGPVSAECGSIVLHELLKHYLYIRCQIPGVYDDLCWQLQVRSCAAKESSLSSISIFALSRPAYSIWTSHACTSTSSHPVE